MTQTFFQDFNRDDGSPVTVEFSHRPGHSDGDIQIVSAWPNTPEYNDLHRRRQDITGNYGQELSPIAFSMMSPELQEKLTDIDKAIEHLDESSKLTPAEDDRMCEWLAEHHVFEPYEDYDF